MEKKILESPPNFNQAGTKYLFCLIKFKNPRVALLRVKEKKSMFSNFYTINRAC